MSNDLFLRKYKITTSSNMEIDFSDLHCIFDIVTTDLTRPQACNLRVYNITKNSIKDIKLGDTLTIEAGYESNSDVIFKGAIKSIRYGRVNNLDIYFDIRASNNAQLTEITFNKTYDKGTAQNQVFKDLLSSLNTDNSGISGGESFPLTKYLRGKVAYGNSVDKLNELTYSNDYRVIFVNDKIFVYNPDTAFIAETVVLSSATGLIGRPKLTLEGITGVTLLNPKLKIGSLVKITQETIDDYLMPTEYGKINRPVPSYDADSIYKLIQVSYKGDTRGTDWYINFLAIDKNTSRGVMGKAIGVPNV